MPRTTKTTTKAKKRRTAPRWIVQNKEEELSVTWSAYHFGRKSYGWFCSQKLEVRNYNNDPEVVKFAKSVANALNASKVKPLDDAAGETY